MNVIIIPGFTGYPDEKTFEDLTRALTNKGHKVIKLAWPNFPNELGGYNFTNTIKYTQEILKNLEPSNTVILGFSMGGVIACHLAKEFNPKRLGLVVSPYQAGSEDDLAGKYKDWKEKGYRDITSSRFGDLRIPFSFIEDAKKYNALEMIDKIECPILFIVGENDNKVPKNVTRKLHDKASNPKEWIEIKDMEHKYQYQPKILKKVNEYILRFISEQTY